jgi:hypothetical protein
MRSLEIDVRFDEGRVRVKRATGASERRTANDMEAMLRFLWNAPGLRHFVEEIAANKRNLIDVYAAYVTRRLEGLGAMFDDGEVASLKDAWLAEFQASESHKRRYRQAFTALLAQQRRTAVLSDLPALLMRYRAACIAAGTPRAFNYAKMGCLALIRDKLGKRHPLRTDVADITGMPEAKDGVLGLSIDEARDVRRKLESMEFYPKGAKREDRVDHTMGPHAARIWWAMCVTGMGTTEYWGEWEVLADRVRIRGTKRPGRRWGSQGREVPLIVAPIRPEIAPDRFAKLLKKAGASPYQGRHSYGCWMEDAEIPRTRREMYLGHGVKDVTAKYERREITRFLQEDRDRLLKVLGSDSMLQLMRSQGIVTGQQLAQGTGA